MEKNKIKNPSSSPSNLRDYKEKNKAEKSKKPSKKLLKRVKNSPTDLEHIKKQIFPAHTERGAYNQLCAKVGKRPLNDKEYEQLKRTKRRPDSTYEESKNINMAKNIIRLTESDLHNIVKESVERILAEEEFNRQKAITKQIGKIMRDKDGIKKNAERRKKFGGRSLEQMTDDELKGLDND